MSTIVKKEAKQFYAMLALLKCAEQYKDYLLACNAVHGTVKYAVTGLFNRFKIFLNDVTAGMPEADRKLWEADWNRDYLSYSAVFEHMADMDDNQRELLEQLAESVLKREISAELKQAS